MQVYETEDMCGHFNESCIYLQCNATFPTLVRCSTSDESVICPRLCYHHRFTNLWRNSWSVSRGGCSLGLCHTHGTDWCASWRSGRKCCRGCGRGKIPWPHSARSARFSSVTQSHSNPRSARTEAVDDPGSWGTSLLSSPTHQTPSQDSKK